MPRNGPIPPLKAPEARATPSARRKEAFKRLAVVACKCRPELNPVSRADSKRSAANGLIPRSPCC